MRGVGKQATLQYLKTLIHQHKPMMIGILEPKRSGVRINEYARKLGYTGCLHGEPINTYIWIFWRLDIDIQVEDIHPQAITVGISSSTFTKMKCTVVYASCNRNDRKVLWDYLVQHGQAQEPWLIGGDFNTILNVAEKKGGNLPSLGSIQDFHECIVAAGGHDKFQEINEEGEFRLGLG